MNLTELDHDQSQQVEMTQRRVLRSPAQRFVRGVLTGAIVVCLLLVLGVATYFSVSWYIGANRLVHVVNGTDVTYTVELNGRSIRLQPRSLERIRIAEGDVTVRVSDTRIPIEDQTVRIKTPITVRPLIDWTFVINPDRTALIGGEVAEYRPDAPPRRVPSEWKLFTGRNLHVFTDPDYVFEPFPSGVKQTARAEIVRKSRIDQLFVDDQKAKCDLILGRAGASVAGRHLQQAVRFDPDNEDLCELAFLHLNHQTLIRLLEPELDRHPLLVKWHRIYQDKMEWNQPEVDLTPRYRRLMEMYPDDPEAKYLYARSLRDEAERIAILRELAGLPAPPIEALHSLTLRCMTQGQFEEALSLARRLRNAEPDDDHILWHLQEALLAAGHAEESLVVNARRIALRPDDGELRCDRMMLLHVLDRPEDAKVVADEFVEFIRNSEGDQAADDWAAYFAAVIDYLDGEVRRSGARLLQTSNDEWRFIGLIGLGRFDQALAMIADGQVSPKESGQVLALAAIRAGQREVAAQALAHSVSRLQRGYQSDRLKAAWIRSQSEPACEDVCIFAEYVQPKLITLSLMSVTDAEHADCYATLAKRLNFDPRFPSRLVSEVLDAVPASSPN